jgi:hypothetical protein
MSAIKQGSQSSDQLLLLARSLIASVLECVRGDLLQRHSRARRDEVGQQLQA